MPDEKNKFISDKYLARNVGFNLVGTITPLLVALIAIPQLLEGLGTERFGVLLLVWTVIGYFNVFDLGLGRALAKFVAEKLAKEKSDEIPLVIWSVIILMGGVGVFASFLFAILSPWLAREILNVSSELQTETITSFYFLALALPFVITTTGLRGVVEAHQRFGLINTIRIPFALITFLAPLVVLSFSSNVSSIVASLVIARLLYWGGYVVLCILVEPDLRFTYGIQRELLVPLFKFGGWLTLVNLIKPLMVYMDRFLIGAILTMTAVAYYTTPYEIVTKFWIIPGALMSVMFPAFSTIIVQDKERAARLFDKVVKYIFYVLFPFVFITVTFSEDGLRWWLGNEFAINSTIVMQLLTTGVFINSLAHVPSGMMQSAGRPDILAKMHLIELPIYLFLLWLMLNNFGIAGAAIAWVLRVSIDSIALFIFVNNLFPTTYSFTLIPVICFFMTLIALLFGALITSITIKIFYVIFVLFIFTIIVWNIGLSVKEKTLMIKYLKPIFL